MPLALSSCRSAVWSRRNRAQSVSFKPFRAHRLKNWERCAALAQGWEVNHKRVARLMREDGLLAIRKRRFIPQTTDSGHDFEVALNVAHRLIPTAIDQL